MTVECGVCGANGPIIVRPGNGHAEWCERIRAWLRAEGTYGAVPHGHHRCYPRGCQRQECRAAHLAWRRDRRKALAASPRGERATEGGACAGEVVGAPHRGRE